MPIAIENNRGQFQYQIFKAGELAGYVQYSMDGADMWVLHTSMKRQFKSALLTDMLIHHVLTDAHASRLAILPFCPAVRAFIAEHREFSYLVTDEWQDRIPSPAHQKTDADATIPLDFVRLTGSRRARHLETTVDSPDVAQYVSGETGSIALIHLQDPEALAALQDPAEQPAEG